MQTIVLRDGGLCELHQGFVGPSETAQLFADLRGEVPWEEREIQIFGRAILQPRLVAWLGDSDAVYTYSRTRHEPAPWTASLAKLRDRVADAAGVSFNSVLCNLYRDGRDSMGMHADREPELGSKPVIASLSLGATRRFSLRHRHAHPDSKVDLALDDGSLLIMRGTTQQHYRHGVPKEPKVNAARINLTFRRVYPELRVPSSNEGRGTSSSDQGTP